MNLIEFLQELIIKDWSFWSDNNQLRYRAPKEERSISSVLAQIKIHKVEILQLLQERPEIFYAYSLSYGQKALWFLWQLAPESNAYNVSLPVHICSFVDIAAMEKALIVLMKRHPLLQTTFPRKGEKQIQQVHQNQQLDFLQIDASTYWCENELKAKVIEAHRIPFDLEKGPIMRVRWFILSDKEHILLLTMHHIVCDHRSLGILLQELLQIYHAQQTGIEPNFPFIKHSYQDYVVCQKKMLSGTQGEQLWSYWQKQLAGNLPILNLVTDRQRPPIQTYNGAVHKFKLSSRLTSQVKEQAKSSGVTLYMMLLAVFEVLLHRYTGQDDILVGSPILGRSQAEFASIVGYFANPVVMRADLSNNPSFQEFLIQVRQTVLGALAHQDYPFYLLTENLQLDRDPSRSPIFQVSFALLRHSQTTLFSLANEAGESPYLGEMQLDFFDIPMNEGQFDLVLEMIEEDSFVLGIFKYNTDLFDGSTIERMAAHFQNLLSAIVDNPQQVVGELPLLSAAERQQLLVEWNDTASEYPGEQCIHQLFEEQVQRTPDAVAVVFETEQLTYQQLNHKANQVAHYLHSLGVGPELLVGICVERSMTMVVGLLGILKAGGVYVPLDPTYPQERLSYVLADAGVKVLLTQQEVLSSLPSHGVQTICLDTDWVTIDQHSRHNLQTGVSSDNLAYVMYTSGSTGQPKGVQIKHQSPVALCHWAKEIFSTSELSGVLAATSICFDLSVFEIFTTLCLGGKVILVDNALCIPNLEKARAEEITLINTVPAAIAELLRIGGIPKGVKTVNLAGEPLTNQIVEHLYQHQNIQKVYNLYGPSEDTTYSTFALVEKGRTEALPPIGRPIANSQIYILNEYLQPVPIGVPGELHIGGDGLARGYLNRPELNQENFISNPFDDSKSTRLYKTGDLARYLSDGKIEFLGRIDRQVKIRGFRIELGEIEAVLITHPQIQASVVIDTDGISTYKRLVAYVVPNQNKENQAANQLQSLQLEQWQQIWKGVYDNGYGESVEVEQSTYNTIGWKSSYTGNQIPQDQMRQWVDSTVERILEWQPKNILEIGCGTGMLLLQIAPHCLSYSGTDISQAALDYIKKQIEQLEDSYLDVSLVRKSAHDFIDIEEGQFDTIILNSVVQYFPSINYLVEVLQNAVNTLSEGGFIFVGDVRSLPLLETFHTATNFDRASDSLTIERLMRYAKDDLDRDEELVIDPAFFHALKQHLPQIKYVQIQLKPGTYHNELTKFRYDVTLHVSDTVCSQVTPEWLKYDNDSLNLMAIKQLLLDEKPDVLGIKHIPNPRLQQETTLLDLIRDSDGQETIGQFRKISQQKKQIGVDPNNLWSLKNELPYTVQLNWSSTGGNACYDAVFVRNKSGVASPRVFPRMEVINEIKAWSDYANNPLKQQSNRHLVLQLPNFLKQRLPEYMVPSAFITLDTLPLTPNGKVDRKALPAPDGEITRESDYVGPRTAIEQTLTNIWQKLLIKDKVSIHDNFFEIGGDSIVSIQLVFLAKNSGIQITPQQVFQNQTIAELAKIANTTNSVSAQQGIVTGIAPLTPIQHWFFSQNRQEPHHYNQSVLLRIPNIFQSELIKTAFKKILEHHDALRLRFTSQGSELKQINQDFDDDISFSMIDLSSTPKPLRVQELSRIATEFQARLNLSTGMLVQVVMFNLGIEDDARLLIITHHLAIDGVSWRILLSDLQEIYQQLIAGQPLQLSVKTTAFIDWAEKINTYAQSEVLKQQLDYWLNQPWASITSLPLDYVCKQSDNTVSSADVVSVKLSEEETRILLGEVNEAYNTQINDILLSALVISLRQWLGNSTVLIDLEGHGREELFEDVDLSRTVGWFTNLFPVLLQLPSSDEPATAIQLVKERLQAIPGRGMSYGILRYLCEDTNIKQQLQIIPASEICFNYLGQFDQIQAQTGWKFADEPTGSNYNLQQIRSHLLDINCLVVEGELQIEWGYSKNIHTHATVENLAQSYIQALRSLIQHCQLKATKEGCKPSYSPLSQFNQEKLILTTLPAIIPAPEERYQPFHLTDIQQAYWLGRSQNFDLGNIATHVYLEIDCLHLNLAQLNQAWQKLIEHHDMLRAVILPSGQQQVLEQVPAFEIEVLDLCSSSPEAIEGQLETIRERMSHEVLPAEQWPLFKICATKIDTDQTRIHFSYDNLIIDAWSMMLLVKQWQQLYQEPQTVLPSLEISFQDYICAELSLRATPQYQQSQEYWFNRHLPPAPELPFAIHPSSITKPKFKRYRAQLNPQKWQTLKQRATTANITPTAVLLSAFADILNYWSKNPNFTINLTLFNRLPLHPQVNQLVGDFTSLLLLEVDCSNIDTFTARSQKLQQQLWQDLEYRDVSGVEVQRELRRQRGHAQPMGVVFTSMTGSLLKDASLNQFGELVYSITQTPQVWLDHQIVEEGGALVFNWDVVEELFPPNLIDDMFTAYCNWLEQLADSEVVWDETQPQLLPPVQLAKHSAINNTSVPISSKTLHGLFQAQVSLSPQSLAVITPERSLTYQELSELANSLGHQLQQLGATPNTLVAVIMEKGWEQVVAVLGILMSGAAYLPINPELPPERQWYLLEQGQVQIVVTQIQLKQSLSLPVGMECLAIDAVQLKAAASEPIRSSQNPDDLAYVIYTSGSTGLPKGVTLSHRGVVNTLLDINQRFEVGVNDRVLALSELNFDLSVYDIFGILAVGGAVVIPEPTPGRKNDPAHWLELINAHQVTIWNTVPALMQMLVEYLEGQPHIQVGELRLALLSGDWLPVRLPQQIQSLWSDLQVISLGGATEASIWSILYPIMKVEPNWKSIPYGKPMHNQRFYVFNHRMQLTPTWVSGELYIGGIGLALGYWQDEEKTQKSFINHPITQERLYKTGDLGRYLPSGDIEFLGREDFQVKINGYRIELGEIEWALTQHYAVKEAVVNSFNNKLLAYVILEQTVVDNAQNLANPLEAYQPEQLQGVILNPIDRMEFKLKQPGLQQFSSDQTTINLPGVDIDEVKRQAYVERKSYREFLEEPIPLEKFSEFLSCLLQLKVDDFPLPKYRYPSAGNLYPVQTYLSIKSGGVPGIDPGIYYYHPRQHCLILVSSNPEIETDIYGGNQPIFDRAAFSIYLIGKLSAIAPMYGEIARDFCLLEAGHIGQLLMESAPKQDIGLCPIGHLEFSRIQAHFELEPNQVLLYSLIGGQIAPAQKTQLLSSPPVKGNNSISVEMLKHLKRKLPSYLIPNECLILDALPLTPNGKVDRQSLPLPDATNSQSEVIYVAPRNAVEEQLVQIWSDVIGHERVGIYDNFFELGGDSLGATRVISRIRELFQLDFSLKDFFETPTINNISEYLEIAIRALKIPEHPDELKERIEI
jgi:amino acid adenylation domain-containing protein/non-ribosomal peptide synthase protein (TIGR01720 family)